MALHCTTFSRISIFSTAIKARLDARHKQTVAGELLGKEATLASRCVKASLDKSTKTKKTTREDDA
jgi:hypothetical protein